MWHRTYRDHVIMAFPSYDAATNSWAPQAHISWVVGAARESSFIRFPLRVASESEAVDCALSAAKQWIDRHKQETSARWDAGLKRPSPISAASGDLSLRDRPQAIRRDATLSKASGSHFTFEDFKAIVGALGVLVSERSMLKSYAALSELRRNRHCSWAQIKARLKRSQEQLTSARLMSRRTKFTRLPLTSRGWRRMI